MKEQIYKICTQLNDGQIAVTEATEHLLDLFAVVGRSEQLKTFADYAQKRMWEARDKDLSEFVDEFLRL